LFEEGGLPLRRELRARYLLPTQIDLVDFARVGDAVERVGVEHDENGP